MFLIDVLLIYYRPAYRLFILDEDDWCAQGRYENIINRTPTAEDYIRLTKDENDKYIIHILGVCFTIAFKLVFSK